MSSREQYKGYVSGLHRRLKEVKEANQELRVLNQGLINTIKEHRRKMSKQGIEINNLHKVIKKSKRWYQIIIRI